MTAQSIFTQSWIDLGVGSPGETPSASESSNGLNKLNQMLDNWSGARDLVYEIALAIYALTNTQSFPIGPTATAPFNVQRPVRVENANILITSASGKVSRTPLRIISQAEWESMPDRANATGLLPEKLYIDPQVPNAVLNLTPIPLCGAGDNTSLELGTWTYIQQFALLSTNANLPPAYARAIILGLELELAPTYGQVNPGIIQQRAGQFQEAIAVVRDLNSKVQVIPLSPVPTQQGQQQNPQQIQQLLASLSARGQQG